MNGINKKAKGRMAMHSKAQEERLDYLLHEFKEDSGRYRELEAGEDYGDKRMALRSLMNIRMPGYMKEDVVRIQNEFLAEEAKEKGIVTLEDIPSIKEAYGNESPYGEKISIWQGDITRLSVDAIVNAANSQMLGCFVPCHRCIDNAIHSSAGIQLREECSHYMSRRRMQYGKGYEEPTGQAVLTKGYALPAKHVIHTVGPIVGYRLTDKLRKDLENCYRNVLLCCAENQIRTVAFCCISTGEFHFPNDEAAKIAVKTVARMLAEHGREFDRVIFNVFKDEDKEIYERELRKL
ncbi:MAG: protein-ADP-ribose hydrolase [Clostridium sp.]|nr:protein-ADP-ribose hydrolase [Clostridium sp.]